jgi:drug/metabolite transporter (DMT)-like permease
MPGGQPPRPDSAVVSGVVARLSPLLVLAFGGICISFAAIFVKMLGVNVMGPTAIGFWRAILGAAMLFVWAAAAGRNLIMERPVYLWSLLAGFLFFLDLFFWHRSIIYAGAGMATILANIQVFVTAGLSFLVFKEHLSLKFFAAAVAAVVGVVLLIGIGSGIEFSRTYLAGVALGLATGFCYASYIIVMKFAGQHARRPDFRTLMAWTSLFTAMFLAAASPWEEAAFLPPDLYSLLVLVALALVVQTVGWWSITTSLPRLDASRSGLVLLLQPVLATVWGWLFFTERLTPLQLIGAVVTLTAIYVGGARRRV